MAEKVLLIDALNLIFRAYYAFIKNPLKNSKGENTSALYGFTVMLLRMLKEESPDYIAVVFDSPTGSPRESIFPEYKANRPPPPEELVEQIGKVKELCDRLGIARVEREGLEADDAIGILTKEARSKGMEVAIATSDKDLMQLVDEHTQLITTKKGISETIRITPDAVVEKLGVEPKQIVDFLSLMGDKSDNIPGVKGVGETTARDLLSNYGSLEKVLENLEQVQPPRVAKRIADDLENLDLSRRLVELIMDADLDTTVEELRRRDVPPEEIKNLLMELEFFSLVKEFLGEVEETPTLELLPLSSTEDISSFLKGKKMVSLALDRGFLALHDGKRTAVINIDHLGGELANIFSKLPAKTRLVGHYLKGLYRLLVKSWQIKPLGYDTALAAYLVAPEQGHSLPEVAFRELGEVLSKSDEKEGQQSLDFERDRADNLNELAGRAATVHRLQPVLAKKVREAKLGKVLEEIELPLTPVLARLEQRGILVDKGLLEKLSSDLGVKLKELEGGIHREAGMEFNINSPKQLGEVLFEKLQLPLQRKTKTGYSTDNEVLTTLGALHPLPKMVMEYRTLSKLKGTYIDALPEAVNPESGRIHTTFLQTSTATGRLSSRDPNLQNIPIRTELGAKVRQAFIAPEGHLLVSLDYSQIELRIFATLSGDENLISAFRKGEDIHAATARELFAGQEIDRKLRARAKAINFGLIYGKSPYGLSQELDISQEEATEYIKTYFERYPQVRAFMDELKERAHKQGYSETVFGRRRYLPELTSKNPVLRSAAERAAINMPIQGTAADLLKLAMIAIERRLSEEVQLGQMLLTIHDELIFEVPEGGEQKMIDTVKPIMEGVTELEVPIVVDAGVGKNWLSAH